MLRPIHALLVHSPLVGPTTTRALAHALAARGWTTAAPDLRPALSSPQAFAALASRATRRVDVLVGHSGAGALLPVIAEDTDATVTVFVDAVVPHATTSWVPSPELVALLDQLTEVDGLLPPWQDWWPPEVLTRLVPDEQVRAAVTVEIPMLPRAFYDEPITLPARWWQRPASYLQLSPAYEDDRGRAEQMGWPTARCDGQHLDLLTRPDAVADAVIDLTASAHRSITESTARHGS